MQQEGILEQTEYAPLKGSSQALDEGELKKAEEEALKAIRHPLPASSVGWKQIGEWEEKDTLTPDDELIDLTTPTLLDSYIPEAAYGDWYHTTALCIGTGLLSFILGWFNFSLAPVFFVVLAGAVYYRTSIKQYRSLLRDQIQMEFTAQKIENDYETMDWLNTFLEKYWIYLEPSISQMVTEQANPIIASQESIPAFVKAVWIDQFTLGTKPPRIDAVKTLDIAGKNDIVVMDWAFSFTPNETADNSAKQLKNHVNQRAVVKATLFGLTLPVIVEDVAVSAKARVRLQFRAEFPHVEFVSVTLTEAPEFDFVSRLLGESVFNWEILAIPGLYPLMNEMLRKFVGPMVFDPFSFQLNIPQLLSGSTTSVGVIALHIRSAKDLRAADRVIGNTVDPYLTFRYHGDNKVYGKTKTILDTLAPKWDQNIYVLVKSFTEPMVITLWDYNPDRKDKRLGKLHLSMNEVLANPVGKGKVGHFLRSSKPCGELLFDYTFHKTLEPVILEDGSTEPAPELNTGLTKIELTELRNVKTDDKVLSSYTELYFNDDLVETTGVFKKNENPTFSIPFEAIVTDRRKAKVKVLVKDPKGKVIAASIQSLNSLIDRAEIGKPWVPFTLGEGEFKVQTQWKAVNLPDAEGAGGYSEPIGVVRVLLSKAESLRNLEKLGKVDPYARVLVNGSQRGRTDMILETLDPEWHESVWITITSPNQRITLEVMDAEKGGKDRTLGSFDIKTSEIVSRDDDDDKYVQHIDKEMRTGKLIHKKGPKGSLTYALSFYPVIPVKSLEDIQDEIAAKEKRERAETEQKTEKDNEGKDKKPKDEDKAANGLDLDALNDNSKVEMPLSELLDHTTGVLVLHFIGGEFAMVKTYLQLFFDGDAHPDVVTPQIQSKLSGSRISSDFVVKQLEWSTCTFRLVKNKDANRADEAVAETTIPTLALLKNTFDAPSILTLNGMGVNKVKIQTRWVPLVDTELPASDLITNSGTLDLEILSADNLAAADSNGKSDPFVKCYINNKEDSFFKTKTVKKTLNPVWSDEKTNIEISNRVNTVIRFKVLDWDFGAGQDDTLGKARLELADIDPVKPNTYDIPIIGKSGAQEGTLHVKCTFRPAYIVKLKTLKTNLGDAGLKTIGTGLGHGLKGGKAAIGGGAHAVGRVTKGIFGGKKHDEEK